MIALETTSVCPAGLTAAVALEQLHDAYALRVVPEGHFLARYGAPGPRLVETDTARLGGNAVAAVLERCVADASAAARRVVEHVGSRLVPATIRVARADAATRTEALAALRAELAALEALVAVTPRADLASGVIVPALVPVVLLFGRGLVARDDFPALAAHAADAGSSDAFTRATARIASLRLATPDEVIEFWIGAPIETADDAVARVRRWFQGGEALDAEVRARFLPTIEAALRGELDTWTATTRGRLALVLVLDQLTRNAFRGDPRTWSGDPRALALCTETLDLGLDAELGYVERVFLTMPLLHAEDAAALARAVEDAHRGRAAAPPPFVRIADARVEQAEKYAAIVARFGRFPFRNAVLGRASTPAEEAFLVDFAGKGPPSVMRDAR